MVTTQIIIKKQVTNKQFRQIIGRMRILRNFQIWKVWRFLYGWKEYVTNFLNNFQNQTLSFLYKVKDQKKKNSKNSKIRVGAPQDRCTSHSVRSKGVLPQGTGVLFLLSKPALPAGRHSNRAQARCSLCSA